LQGVPPINRFALPDSPVERIKLVHQCKVPRIYINPMWVGDPNFDIDGYQFEVMTKEMPLKAL
jgi:hypothetical protein